MTDQNATIAAIAGAIDSIAAVRAEIESLRAMIPAALPEVQDNLQRVASAFMGATLLVNEDMTRVRDHFAAQAGK